MISTVDKLPITVVILSKNEEQVIADAIKSAINYFAEVVVLDSHSDDVTVEIALEAGAKIVQNVFNGYASQRNYALKIMPKSNEWIFFLDADERISKDLIFELNEKFHEIAKSGYGMAYVRRKDYFMGKWIRRSSGYPTWFGRLCHASSVHVEREINEEYCCDLPTLRLDAHLLHYPFSKGLSNWLDRHNRYSTGEAIEKIRVSQSKISLLFSSNPGMRRKGLKQIYSKLPCRPLFGFIYLYFLRRGFLDGGAGLYFSLLRSFYEMLIDLKCSELISINGGVES